MTALGRLGAALTLCAACAGAQAQENLGKVEALHFELVGKAKQILIEHGVAAKDQARIAEVRALLERARGLKIRRPRGEIVYRSVDADFYFAWILCRSAQPDDPKRGALLLRQILQNDHLSPRRHELAERELQGCDGRPQAAPRFEEKGRLLITAVQKGGRGGSQPLHFPNPAALPRVSWPESARAAEALRKLLGSGYRVVAAEPFIVAGRKQERYLRAITERVLKPYHRYLAAHIGDSDGDPIFAVVASDPAEMIRVSHALYGISPQASPITRDSVIAYSDSAARLMVAVCGKDPANCTSFAHELFHLLNGRAYEGAPWWLYEGAAELFESGELVGGEFVPRVGWRKRDLVLADVNPSGLEKLLRLSKNAAYASQWPGPEAEMAKARFFAQFLHERHKLWEVYEAMLARPADASAADLSGAMTVAQIVAPLDRLGVEFSRWVKERVVPAKAAPGP